MRYNRKWKSITRKYFSIDFIAFVILYCFHSHTQKIKTVILLDFINVFDKINVTAEKYCYKDFNHQLNI